MVQKGLYWRLLIGITLLHMLEDAIMVTFFKFAPLPLWVLYILVLLFSCVMANYAYLIANRSLLSTFKKVCRLWKYQMS